MFIRDSVWAPSSWGWSQAASSPRHSFRACGRVPTRELRICTFAMEVVDMKILSSTLASPLLIAASTGHAQSSLGGSSMLPSEQLRTVAPALDRYTQERLLGEVWKRPGLSGRDRSIVTLAVLITRNQSIELPFYMNRALDSGVKPSEISEIITHLAFYSEISLGLTPLS